MSRLKGRCSGVEYPISRRAVLGALGLSALTPSFVAGFAGNAGAADAAGGLRNLHYFRIGTGTTSGTYFPLGGLIANAISNPPGSRPCEKGGSCGVPGLIAVAQATSGSVENIALLRKNGVEAAMAQADLVWAAYSGIGPFAGQAPFEGLRSMGVLYPEAIQIVVRADSNIRRIPDLRSRAVSVGEEGSGILVEARMVLEAHGLTEKDIWPSYLKPATAADRLAAGQLDAFFMVGGYPVAALSDVAARVPIRLVPLDGEEAQQLRRSQRFYQSEIIPADTYPGVDPTPTLTVGAELVCDVNANADLIHGVLRALWHESTLRLLAESHPRGRSFDPVRAVSGISVPLHGGAERYYREVGLLGNAANEAEEPGSEPAADAETP